MYSSDGSSQVELQQKMQTYEIPSLYLFIWLRTYIFTTFERQKHQFPGNLIQA